MSLRTYDIPLPLSRLLFSYPDECHGRSSGLEAKKSRGRIRVPWQTTNISYFSFAQYSASLALGESTFVLQGDSNNNTVWKLNTYLYFQVETQHRTVPFNPVCVLWLIVSVFDDSLPMLKDQYVFYGLKGRCFQLCL